MALETPPESSLLSTVPFQGRNHFVPLLEGTKMCLSCCYLLSYCLCLPSSPINGSFVSLAFYLLVYLSFFGVPSLKISNVPLGFRQLKPFAYLWMTMNQDEADEGKEYRATCFCCSARVTYPFPLSSNPSILALPPHLVFTRALLLFGCSSHLHGCWLY